MKLNIQCTALSFENFAGAINNELAKTKPISISVREFADLVGRKKYTFNSCIHKPVWDSSKNRLVQSNETAVSWQILALDFEPKENQENPLTASHVLDILSNKLAYPNFIYTTRNNPPDKNTLETAVRFRCVYVLSEPVILNETELENRYNFYRMFKPFLPNLDVSPCDPNRFFYGGENLLYENYDTYIEYDVLKSLSETFPIRNLSKKHFRNKLNENNPTNEKDRKREISNNIIIQNIKKQTKLLVLKPKDWTKAKNTCPLLKMFLDTEEKIIHNDLFLLYLLLSNIKGGVKLWNKKVKENPLIDTDDKVYHINDWVKKEKKGGRVFSEPPLRKFFPDDELPENYPQYLTAIFKDSKNFKTKKVEDIKVDERDLLSVRNELQIEIEAFLKDGGKKFIKAPTGTGKTTTLKKLLISSPDFTEGLILAFPRHDLIEEHEKTFLLNKVNYHRILPIPDFESNKLNDKKIILYKRGFHKEFRKILYGIISNQVDIIIQYNPSESDIEKIRDYLNSIEIAKEFKGLVLTTHKSTLFHDFPIHKRLIYDENPIDGMLEIHSVSYKAFFSALSKFKELSDELNKLDEQILNLNFEKNQLNFISNPIDLKKFEHLKLYEIDIDEIGFILNAPEILVITKRGKPDRLVVGNLHRPRGFKDILVMSATANQDLLFKVFKKMEMVDLGYVKLVGEVHQFLNKSFSKQTLSYDEEAKIFEEINKFKGNTMVISVVAENLKKYIKSDGNFNNVSGTNNFIGKDVIIIGTVFLEDFVIPLWAHTLGISFENTEIDFINVTRNGFILNIRTFKDVTLQEIQLQWMESLLTQAVGRARLASEKRKVVIFSKIPYLQAIHHTDYKKQEIPQFLYSSVHLTGSFIDSSIKSENINISSGSGELNHYNYNFEEVTGSLSDTSKSSINLDEFFRLYGEIEDEIPNKIKKNDGDRIYYILKRD